MFDVEMPIGQLPMGSRTHSTSFSSVVHNGRTRMSSADYSSLPAFRHNSAGSRQSSVDGLPAIYMPPVSARSTKLTRKINRCQSRDDFYLVESVERYLLSNDVLAPCPDPEDPVTDRSPVIINAQYNSADANPTTRYPASSLQHNDDGYMYANRSGGGGGGGSGKSTSSIKSQESSDSTGSSGSGKSKKTKGPSPLNVDKSLVAAFSASKCFILSRCCRSAQAAVRPSLKIDRRRGEERRRERGGWEEGLTALAEHPLSC